MHDRVWSLHGLWKKIVPALSRRSRMNTKPGWIICLAACVSCGALGYKWGVDQGSRAAIYLANQSAISESIGELDAALSALKRNDFNFSQTQHRSRLVLALSRIVSLRHQVPYWECSERETSTLREAAAYIRSHPEQFALGSPGATALGFESCESGRNGPSARK